MAKNIEHLGRISNKPIRELNLVEWKGDGILVRFDCTEFSSHCPVTGQPDFAQLEISYVPGQHIVETKSLKLYLWSFRDERKFNELLVDQIANEFYDQVKPAWVEVIGSFNPRGGIALTAQTIRGKR